MIDILKSEKPSPVKLIGYTRAGKPVAAGAYQMLEEMKMPLAAFMHECGKRGWSCSVPHFFACALEGFRTDAWAFDQIAAAFKMLGREKEIKNIRAVCETLLRAAYNRLPYEARAAPWEVAREMRFALEQDQYYRKSAKRPK